MSNTEQSHSLRSLIIISIPTTLGVMVEPIAGLVDTALIGHLGQNWLACLGICTAIFSSFIWVFNFLVYGVNARIAQNLGEGDMGALGQNLMLAIVTALACGAGAIGILLLLQSWLLNGLMATPTELISEANSYYLIRCLSLPMILLLNVFTGALRGLQLYAYSFVVLLIVTLSNVAISYVLIYQQGYGLTGAAIGTTASFAIGLLVAIPVFWARRHALRIDLRRFRPAWADILDFGAEAFDLFGRTASLLGCFMLAMSIASRLGTAEAAAHQIAYQYWILASFFMDGLAITATSIGGKLIGEGKHREFRIVSWRLQLLSIVLGCILGLCYLSVPGFFYELFTKDEEVIAALSSVWLIIALSQPLNGLTFILDGVLFGAREFRYLRKRIVEAFAIVFLPIAVCSWIYWESLVGVWLAIAGVSLYRGATSLMRERSL